MKKHQWWQKYDLKQNHVSKNLCIVEDLLKQEAYLTFWKMSRTFFSDSPMYMLISSGPFTLRKFREHSVATAFANKVWDLTQE